MNLTVLRPTQFRHCFENPQGLVAVQAIRLFPPRDSNPPAGRAGPEVLSLFAQTSRILKSASSAQLGLARATSGSPSGQCKHIFLPRDPRRGHLPPLSLPAGRPIRSSPGRGATAGSEAAVDAVPRRAFPPSGSRPGSSPLWGAPSTPAQCTAGGGAQIPVSSGGGGDRQFSLRRSSKQTRWLFTPLSPP